MKIAFMGIRLPALRQNDPTKLVVWIFGGQSTVPPLQSSLRVEDKGFDQYTSPLLFKNYMKIKFWHTLFLRGARVRSFSSLD